MSLLRACMTNDMAEIKRLVTCSDVDVNMPRDERGRSTLHIAACRGNVQLLWLLHQYGGDCFAKDDIGNTLMHMCNHLDVIEFFSQQKLSVLERNLNGDTPLKLAVRFGASRQVLQLLQQLEEDEIQERPPEHCPLQ